MNGYRLLKCNAKLTSLGDPRKHAEVSYKARNYDGTSNAKPEPGTEELIRTQKAVLGNCGPSNRRLCQRWIADMEQTFDDGFITESIVV